MSDIQPRPLTWVQSDLVVWTPGVSSGNPVSLKLLSDFAAIGDKQDKLTEDERIQAVEMARATLAQYLGGTGQGWPMDSRINSLNLRSILCADALNAQHIDSLHGRLPEPSPQVPLQYFVMPACS
jgi:hypothetical protein